MSADLQALRLQGLSKRFGALQVTRDVSLDVRADEIHALIGPNGAGKSTLMAQIAGQLAPDGGRVWLQGVDVTRWTPHRRARHGLARTFQISSVFRSMSAQENVALAQRARRGQASAWRRFAASLAGGASSVLSQMHFAADPTARAATLDYGAVRQIELAMGLATAPKVLLLDEPLAGLSAAEAEQAVGLLASLRGRFGMLLIEHDINAVFSIADRITVLVAGAVIATGTPDQIRADEGVRRAYLGEP
ncbi:ABC transporter ATP-binding protein [Aquabacterium sp. J223]|uniref:ABC transporter ATP-binding protein n=1 Tax=Aquabacterium sp. J223 TaxID=2898431 RepID=UPI0021ADE4D4|nr:ABC transporter ATP-binding protein [Aquabacterium sp. J223]UUX95280.1 ABC transporter ATP-binding protein [Aquabacterium sp. J223]